MPWIPSPPHYLKNVTYQVHFAAMGVVTIKGADFKDAFDIDAKRGDRKTVEKEARRLWPVLELIARDAVEDSLVLDTGTIGHPAFTIDRATLDHYIEKYAAFLERR